MTTADELWPKVNQAILDWSLRREDKPGATEESWRSLAEHIHDTLGRKVTVAVIPQVSKPNIKVDWLGPNGEFPENGPDIIEDGIFVFDLADEDGWACWVTVAEHSPWFQATIRSKPRRGEPGVGGAPSEPGEAPSSQTADHVHDSRGVEDGARAGAVRPWAARVEREPKK